MSGGPTPTSTVSGVTPFKVPQPVEYEDDEDDESYPSPTDEGDDITEDLVTATPDVGQAHLRYEEVEYKDEYGNIIPEDELSALLEEQGQNIEFRTVYETQTRILKPGEKPPPGAKRIPYVPAGDD